jgi:radical SAM superfamily enzyme YgiQ (UPF0313 family)
LPIDRERKMVMTKRPRIILVRPDYDILEKFSKPVECLALGYLASALREDHIDVVILDGMMYQWNNEETAKHILVCLPTIVGFTVVLNYFPENLRQIIHLLRTKNFTGPILVGGHAVSFIPEKILECVPELDAVISGEGELSLKQLVRAYHSDEDWKNIPGITARQQGKIIRCPPVRQRDLNALSAPARDLVPELINHDGLIAISTSRGCHARCTFCSVPRFYGLYKNKSMAVDDWLSIDVERIVNEVLFLHREYSVKELLIVDDEFFGGRNYGHERAILLGRQLAENGAPVRFAISFRAENTNEKVLTELQKGGLAHVFIGIEAGSSADLKLYGKGHTREQNVSAVRIVKSLGLSFQPGMMIFNHQSTMAEIMYNLDFLQEIDELKPILINSAADPHFGTPLLSVLKRDKVLQDHQLSLSSCYKDPAVEFAKKIAELCANEFMPYMQLICTLQSAVTYEWRREVPNRRPQEKELINAFERSANQKFSKIIYEAFDNIMTQESKGQQVIFEEVTAKIKHVHQELGLAVALLNEHIQKVEGKIRYWSQRDIIHLEKSHYAIFQ